MKITCLRSKRWVSTLNLSDPNSGAKSRSPMRPLLTPVPSEKLFPSLNMTNAHCFPHFSDVRKSGPHRANIFGNYTHLHAKLIYYQ